MSFCRITGKARGLPKPNYFPLLPPISPADAKRCCRITTKSQGLPGHHYIPALLGVRPPKAHCRVTAKSEGQAPHHFPDIEGALKPHDLIPGYKYVFPSFDEGKKQQKLLMTLLSSKIPPGEAKARYVYSVEEKSTGLVIPAELEAAVRDGDVRDVMLDKEGDTMLVKMFRGPNVTIDVVSLVLEEGDVLWDGWGPSEKVLKQRKKEEKEAELRKKKRQQGLMSTKKIFEEREEIAEMEQIEQMKRAEMRKTKLLKVKLRGSNEKSEEVVELNGALTPEVMAPDEPEGTMYGHIVQTATGVEFFPKSSPVELPKGKVVPGRLIKSEEGVRFVPGIMVDGRFVPGQVVVTNTGEQFVPGQVVETSEGPKFVPGQVVETANGPKFVPGQTIETETGPQFVPGQIIETKAGPTFIPGQVIFTDDSPRFVPGRVVETSEGPRFVPGRVIESGNQVSFVSGQVVETPEGLKFVAPDLVDDLEGGHEFSVQGFDITPEELKLLRPMEISNPSNFGGDMAIDSRMLRQLSEAGMSIGRQVPAELPAVDVRSLPQVLERMKLTGVTAVKMGHVLTCLSQVARKINDESDVCVTHIDVNEDMGSGLIHAAEKRKDVAKYLKSIVASAVATIAQEEVITEDFAMAAIASAIDRALGEWAENLPMDGVVEYLHGYLTKPQNISNVAVETVEHLQHNETVLDRLQFAVGASANPAKAADKIAAILKDSMGDAFRKLSTVNPELVQEVLRRLQGREIANNDQQATEMVQHAIVEAVREKSGQFLHKMMLSRDSSEGKEFKDLLLQSIGLARALGMAGVASVLLDVVNDVKSHEVLANDPTTMDILERLMVMRQFAETKPELHSALRQLISDPELARSDPGVRELVRHSAALMIVPEECVQTSADIPASLLMGDNTLAMEEFLVRNRRPRTLLIIKPGMQAVVPRDMARAVITGQVPYAVLDEKGIKYFEPKHLFSTMKLPQYAAHCFSMYVCPEVEDDSGLASPTYSTPRGSVSSYEDLPYRRRSDWNRRSSHYNPAFDHHSSRRGTMQSSHVNTKHILDRRLSDWANGTLFVEKAALSRFEYDSLGCDNNGSISFSNSDEDSSYGQPSDNLNYKLHQVKEELYIVTRDFQADDAISLSLQMGELVTVLDHGDSWSKRLKLDIDEGFGLLDSSTARYKLSIRPRRKHADSRQRAVSPFGSDQARWLVRTVSSTPQSGWVPAIILSPQSGAEDDQRPEDAKYKREAVVRELVETEEEFGRDLLAVVDHYIRPLDSSQTPRIVRDNIDLIFSNFKQIANFHNTVLIEGVKYYASEPRMLGKTFLRLERDFDKHVSYCRDEPTAQDFLIDNPLARDFFEDLSQRIGDDKSLSEHLKLPIQRIHDYQLLLKELVKYSSRLSENTDDLQRALDLMLAVPHRANDNKFISNIEGYHGNIHKLGRLLRHDWFTVTDKEQRSKERYLFLFKARILICKVKRISEDRSVFVLQEIVRLPEVEVQDCEQLTSFQLSHKDPNYENFPITVSAHLPEVKNSWLKEIRKYASDALALQEHAADDLRIQAEESQSRRESTTKNPGNQLKAQLEAKLSKVAKRLETEETHDIVQDAINAQSQYQTTEAPPSKVAKVEAVVGKPPEPEVPPARKVSVKEPPKPQEPTKQPVAEPVKAVPEPKKETAPLTPKVSETTKPVADAVKAPATDKPKVLEVQKPAEKAAEPEKVPAGKEPEKTAEVVKPEPPKTPDPPPAKVTPEVKKPEASIVSEPEKPPPKPVEEPKKPTEPPKTVEEPKKPTEPPKPVEEPKKPTEPPKPVEEPKKPTEPPKPVEEPKKPTEPPKPVEEPKKPTEPPKPVEGPKKPTEPPKPVDEPKKPTEPPKPVEEPKKPTEPPKTVEETKKPAEQKPKPVEEVKKVEEAKPTATPTQKPTTKPEDPKPVVTEPKEKPAAPASKELVKKSQEQEEDMSRRASKTVSSKLVEESYSVSSHHEEVRMESSSYSSSSSMQQMTSSSYQSATSAIQSSGGAAGAITSGASRVTITEVGRPVFTRTISGLNKRPGDSAVFECQLNAEAQVTWLKDNKALEDRLMDRVTKSSSSDNAYRLEIIHLSERDSGIYTALAKNSEGSSTCTAQLLVKEITEEEKARIAAANAPEFSIRLKDTELLTNTNFRFMVKVSGKPNPEVKFYKDGLLISGELGRAVVVSEKADIGFYELVISDVQNEDSGKYTCVAKNKFGETTCEGRVTVTDSKQVFEGLERGELLQPGEKANFSWLRDGKPFDPEERFKVLLGNEEDSLALVFQHVKPEDAGLYTCVASTSTGRISCSAELSVMGTVSQLARDPEKPTLSTEARISEASIGGTAMLEAKVLGFPKPDVRWFHDGKEVKPTGRLKFLFEDQESMTLVIKNVTAEDAGVYKIVAKNDLGEDSTELELTVKSAPKFKRKFTETNCLQGEVLKLTTEIEGCPTPDIKWYRDGKEISQSERIKIEKEGNIYSLIIGCCELTDTASYSVVATNEVNQSSDFVHVKVHAAPKFLKNLEKNMEVSEATKLVFNVSVSADPTPTVKWLKNGNEIKSDDAKYKISSDGGSLTLFVYDTNRDDAGDYTIELRNDFGTKTDTCHVDVKCGPKLTTKLKDTVAHEGCSDVELSVHVNAYPKPSIKWFFEDMEITEKKNEFVKIEEGSEYKLIIKEATLDVEGKYTVKVTNEHGTTEDSCKLTVNCKPRFKKSLPEKTEVDEGASLTLEVECHGCPEPEVKWFKDGKEVSTDAHIKITRDSHRIENYSMTLNLVKANDSGEYEVRATNTMGSVSSKTVVHVYTKTTETTSETREEITTQEITEEETKPVEEVTAEKAKSAVQEGTQDAHSVIETTRTTIHVIEKEGGPAIEEVGSFDFEEKTSFSFSTGIVEEFSDNEGFAEVKKLSVGRGVSIISVSEDEPTLSRNSSINDVKNEINAKLDNDDNYIIRRESSLKEIEEDALSVKSENESIKDKKIQAETVENNVELKNALNNSYDASLAQKGVLDEEIDPEVEALLKRVQKQRSVLQEIIEKEKTPTPGEEDDSNAVDSLVNSSASELKTEEPTLMQEDVVPVNHERVVDELKLGLPEKSENLEAVQLDTSATENPQTAGKLSPDSSESPAYPVISNHDLVERNVFESLSTSYFVQASGIPRPEATWTRDGVQLKSSEKVILSEEGDTYRIEIKDLVIADGGVYQCKISNRLGAVTQEAKLNLTSVNAFRKPIFKVPLENLKVPKTEPAVLTCVIVGDPVPDVTWLHDGKEVHLDDITAIANMDLKEIENNLFECSYSLALPRALHKDTGTYTIVAKNQYGQDESSARLDVQLKPEITNLKDLTAIPYEDAELSAVVHSNPPCTIVWLDKTGAFVRNSEHKILSEDREKEIFKLSFKNVGLGDAGYYTLVAKNEHGDAQQQVHFNVHTEAPTVVRNLDDKRVTDYADVDFLIRFNGVPKVNVKWLKDGEEIISSDRILIETSDEGQVSSTLYIKHFCAKDVGQYSAVGSNLVGSAESTAQLRMVQMPPTFGKLLPRLEEVAETETLDLRCKIDGSPVPAVAWFKDGEPLAADHHVQLTNSPDGSIRLLIENVKPSDCGAYKLVVENPIGSTAAICAVAVKPKPSRPILLKDLENSTEIVGEPLRLEAQIVAYPAPEVKWFKDGVPIRPTQNINFINQPGGIIGLVIDALRPEDAGQYEVKVTNRLGEATGTAAVEVQAREKRPTFDSHLMPVAVVEGFPAKLEVKVSGHPKPTLKWTHKGKEVVPDGQRIRVINQPDGSTALLIDRATPQDAGEWAVVAINDRGEVTSKADLLVAEKGIAGDPESRPAFISPLRALSVEEGGPLIISAPFIGNPIPDVTWTKDGVPIKPDERTLITCDGKKVGLEIKPAQVADTGTYACRLVSPLGESTSEAAAVVRKVFHAPQFAQKFTDLQQLPTYVAKFPARVVGVPRPDIEWFFGDRPIHESEKYHLKRDGDAVCLYIRDCEPSDTGSYRCRASNKEGYDECEARLDVVREIERQQKAEAPYFLKKLGDCETFKGMTARFTACAAGQPDPEVEWFRGDTKLYPNDRVRMDHELNGLLRLSIAGVDVGDCGRYRLQITNPHGQASCEADLRFDDLESRPRKPLADQYHDYDRFRASGVPLPLADRPIISRMTDRHLTLSWKPSIPHGPRVPVTYRVEMSEQPDGDWFSARSGVRSCACDIRNLEPFRDYKFRVRVENKYGVSDPSPFAITYRQKLEPDPPKFVPYLSPGIDFRPETSPYFPKDFDIEKPPHDGYAQAPRFLRQEQDTQYGVKNHNSNMYWFVYGYPKPKVTYTFNDEPIEMGGRYDCSYTRNGQATLFINKMLDRDVGIYEAIASNEHGEARQRVRMDIAEYPVFIERPEETLVMLRKSGRITARVTGVPYPDIKWYKDWQPLAPSSRIKIQQIPPDTVVLIINDAINKDEGLYSISARNVAGAVSSSAMVHIEENEQEYGFMTYGRGRNVKPKNKPLTDFYDLGDELGRGTQGITYHAVERLSGRNYAAKVMHGRSELRAFMQNELDMMNVLNHRKLIRLQDSFEIRDQLVLVLELAGGGELLDTLTTQTFTTETEIACYIRQILWGLEYLHSQDIAHLGLTLRDLLLSHPGGDDLKICDFGLARRIAYGKLAALDYGMPEYVSPEIANGEGVSYPADLWSVGIITYILLSGVSPFKGLNDRETLTRIREGKWEFFEERFCNISAEARDFISKLLVYQPDGRLDVRGALRHPWLHIADKIPAGQFNITTDSLKNYYSSLRDWYNNASCRTWYRRRPLSGAFSHPSRMVYPPGHQYTPEPEDNNVSKEPRDGKTWEQSIPSRDPLDYEVGEFKSESHYQYGPDTYLLQLRDVDLPCRLRRYMKIAANRHSGASVDVMDKHIDIRTPVIRERRRFTDVMDEEIDDERKARINKYGSSEIYSLRRLRHELGVRPDSHAEAEAMLEYRRDGHLPFFREKPQMLAIIDNQYAELSCLAVGEPQPNVQWFKNDLVIVESNRVKIIDDAEGRSILNFLPALHVDVGIYKAVARNKVGQTVARTRVVVASAPESPDSPEAAEISDREILLRWKQPKDDGHSPVLCYSLQYKQADNVEWLTLASNIDHEFWLVSDLKPSTNYVFRLSAKNSIGWSDKGIPTALVKTLDPGAKPIIISKAMRHLQAHTEAGGDITTSDTKTRLNYSVETKPVEVSTDSNLSDKYSFVSELSRGEFSVVIKGVDKSTDQYVVAKLLEVSAQTEEAVAREFDNLRRLQHERIVKLLAALRPAPSVAVLVMEKLQGADILSYFTSRHEYTEQMVATVVTQILDGLQYLHWRGLCHLDLQPDNVVLSSVRSLQIKLIDFGSAKPVTKLGTLVEAPPTDYTAPEILAGELAYPQSDVWSLGTLTYVLLSGVSPFRGETPDETRQNIIFVRYRFEHLFKELTPEGTRFIMSLFKRTPNKRPTVEECHEHRWLLPTDFMIKKRERAVFLGNRLKEYSDFYHGEKAEKAIRTEGLTNSFGGRGPLARSNSIQEELTTSF